MKNAIRKLLTGVVMLFSVLISYNAAFAQCKPILNHTGNKTFCGQTQQTISVTNPTPSTVYAWYVNGVYSHSTWPTHSYNVTVSGTSVYVMTTDPACSTDPFSDPVTVFFESNPPVPVITNNGASAISCTLGETTTLSTGTYDSYSWFKVGNGPTPISTSSTCVVSTEGGYYVVGTNAAGCSEVSNTIAITYSETKPVITNTGSNYIIPGSGQSTTLTASSGFTNYQWKENGVNIPGATSASLAVSTPGVYTVDADNGCTFTSNTIVIKGTPDMDLPGNTICVGTVVTTATGADSYLWERCDNPFSCTSTTTVSTQSTYQPTVASPMAFYRITVTYGSTTTVGPWIAKSVQNNSTPPTTITVFPSSTICAGTSVDFNAPAGAQSYQWKVNGVNVGTNAPALRIATLNNGDVVTCVQTFSYVCTVGNPITSNAITMTVNPIITPSVSISSSDSTVCASNTSITFTATPYVGATSPMYFWYVDGVSKQSGSSNSFIYSTWNLGNNNVYCTLTSSNLCQAFSPALSSTIGVLRNSTTPVGVSISGSSNVCQGANVTFTATPSGTIGANPQYQWRLNGTPISGATSSTYTTNSLVTGNVITCALTPDPATVPCPMVNPAVSSGITMTVNANQNVSVSIAHSTPTTTICAGTNVTFTATPTNGGSTPTYQWLLNGGPVGTNSATYSNNALTNGDIVSCQLITSLTGACVIGSPALSNAFTMTVNPILPVSVSVGISTSTTICAGTNVTFTATPTNGGTTPGYAWTLNGSAVGTNSATYSNNALPNGAVIACMLTSNATCPSASTVTSNSVTMTVNPVTTVGLSIAASASTICSGTNVTFTATPTGGGTAPVYQWKINSTLLSPSSSNTYSSASLVNGDIVSCILYSNATCPSAGIVLSNNITMTVNSCSVTTGTVPTNICAGSTISIPYSSSGTNGSTIYNVLLVYPTGYPISIGTYPGAASSGSFSATIPTTTPAGNLYRIKVVATNPNINGSDNGTNISISDNCGAYQFSGNKFIEIDHDNQYAFGTSPFTIEAWVKLSSASTGEAPILSKTGNGSGSNSGTYTLGIINGTRIFFRANGGANAALSNTFTTIYDNNCHHVAVARIGSTCYFYLDGVAQGSASMGSNVNLNTGRDLIVGREGITNSQLLGIIDDLRIWSTARTQSDINTYKDKVIQGNAINLVSHWQMNEPSGQIVYDIMNREHGILGGTTSVNSNDPDRIAAGACYIPEVRSGLQFDGDNDRVTIPHHTAYNLGNTDFTIEAWVKLQSGSNTDPIISKRPLGSLTGFLMVPYNSGQQLLIQLEGGNNYLSSTGTSFTDNNCHHLAVTRSGNILSFYVDGAPRGTATTSSLYGITSTANLLVGYDLSDARASLGNINEVRFWNRTLSATEVATYRNSDIIYSHPNLIGYWRFNETSGEVVNDVSGIGNHGYLGTLINTFDASNPLRITGTCYAADKIAEGPFENSFVSDSSRFKSTKVTIYPNPFTTTTTLLVTDTKEEGGKYSILDINGKVMIEGDFTINEPTILNPPVAAGIYILQIKRNGRVDQYKILKQ